MTSLSRFLKPITAAASIGFAVVVLCAFLSNTLLHGTEEWVLFGASLIFIGLLAAVWLYFRSHLPDSGRFSMPVWQIAVLLFIVTSLIAWGTASYALHDLNVLTLLRISWEITRIVFVYGVYGFTLHVLGSAVFRAGHITDFYSAEEKVICSIVAGMGIAMLYFYVVSLFGIASLWTTAIFFVTPLLFGRIPLAAFIEYAKRRLRIAIPVRQFGLQERKTLIFVLIALFGILLFMNNASPGRIDGDSLHTYYNIPKRIAETGHIVVFPYFSLNNAALASSYLYLPLIQLGGSYIQFINVALFIVLTASIYIVTKQYFDERSAYYATLIFLTIDLLMFLAVSVKSEYLLMFLIFWSIVALKKAMDTKMYRWSALSGLCMGFAIAVKYNASIAFVSCVIVLLIAIVSGRTYRRVLIKTLLSFCGGVVFAVIPWSVRSVVLFGSPLYPFMLWGTFFSHGGEAGALFRRFAEEYTSAQHEIVRSNGILKNAWLIITNASMYPNNRIGPLIGAVAPFALVRKDTASFVRALAAGISVCIVLWYIISPSQVWYAAFSIPFIVILIGQYISSRVYTWQRVLFGCIIGVAIVMNLPLAHVERVAMLAQPQPVSAKALIPETSIEWYLSHELSKTYPNYLLLQFGPIRHGYVQENEKHIVANLFFEAWIPIVSANEDIDAIRAELQRIGVTHIYYDDHYINALEESICMKARSCATTQLLIDRIQALTSGLRVVHRSQRSIIYILE